MKTKYIEDLLLYKINIQIYKILISSIIGIIPVLLLYAVFYIFKVQPNIVFFFLGSLFTMSISSFFMTRYLIKTKFNLSLLNKIVLLNCATLIITIILSVDYYYFVVKLNSLIAIPTIFFLLILLYSVYFQILFCIFENNNKSYQKIGEILRNNSYLLIKKPILLLINLIIFISSIWLFKHNIILTLLIYPGTFFVINYNARLKESK